jgi:hypothetical protein
MQPWQLSQCEDLDRAGFINLHVFLSRGEITIHVLRRARDIEELYGSEREPR